MTSVEDILKLRSETAGKPVIVTPKEKVITKEVIKEVIKTPSEDTKPVIVTPKI